MSVNAEDLDAGDRGHGNHPGRKTRRGTLIPLLGEAWDRYHHRRRWQAVSALVLFLVAAVVGLTLHRGAGASTPIPLGHRAIIHAQNASSGEVLYPSWAVPTLQQLKSNFAILRRRQTAGDRFNTHCDCEHSARQLNGLSRHAVTLKNGSRVFLDVEQFIIGGQLNMAAGSYVLNLDIVEPDGNTSSEAFGPNTGYMVRPLSSEDPSVLRNNPQASQTFVGVVPDGVATVSWTFGCSAMRQASAACQGAPPRTYEVKVVNNIAAHVISGTRTPCKSCLGGVGPVVVWKAKNGRVLAHFVSGYNLPAAPFVAAQLNTGTRQILRASGIGSAHIGEAAGAATQTISHVLGRPAATNTPIQNCGIDHETVWTSPATTSPLVIDEKNGRFVGYQYGAPISDLGLAPGPGATLTSLSAITISGHLHSLKSTYRSKLTTEIHAHLGRWNAATPSGLLYGYLLPNRYPLQKLKSTDLIATINAGDTGCTPKAP